MTLRQGATSLTGVLSALLCGCLLSRTERTSLPPSAAAPVPVQMNASMIAQTVPAGRVSDYGEQSPSEVIVPAPQPTTHSNGPSAETASPSKPSRPQASAAGVSLPAASAPAPTLPAPQAPRPFPLPDPTSKPLSGQPAASAPSPPARSDPPLVLALRSVLEKRSPAEAERLLQDYDPAQREMLLGLLRDAGALSSSKLDRIPPAEMAPLVDQLNHLSMVLRPRASLVIDNMCFCRNITNFGQYEPLPPDYRGFQAGRDRWLGEEVKIYLEVRNFANHRVGEYYETILRGSLEIWDKEDRPVVPCKELKAEPCRSRTPRQDCFINLWFRVPPGLAPGMYKLWVQIEDVTPAPERGDRPPRVARRALDFQVIGPGLPRRSPRHGEGGMLTR